MLSQGMCELPPSTTPMNQEETVTERLTRRKADLESQLSNVNAALRALEANSEVARCLDLVMKAGRY